MPKDMDKLWAPWRELYVTKMIGKSKGDVLTRIARDKAKDTENLVFVRTKFSYAVLNLYPYNNGHTLVLPLRKVNDLTKLREEERTDLFKLLDYTRNLLDDVLSPEGYNIGINIGRVAGAGFPKHVHIHVVPRWRGDVNFMPVTAQTKIISQSLKVLHKALSDAHCCRAKSTAKPAGKKKK